MGAVPFAVAAQALQLVPIDPVPVGSPQKRVAIVDVNRDGIPDLIAAASTLAVWRGIGNGRFAAAETVTSTGETDFRLADLDRDGNVDLVTLDGRVFLANGDGSFRANPTPFSGAPSALADINGDGCADIVSVVSGEFLSLRPASVAVFPGKCDGTFGPAVRTDLASDQYVRDAVAGDFNGDGRSDVAVSFMGMVHVYNGQADAHVGPAHDTGISLPGIGDVAFGGAFMAVADMNGDGKADVVALPTFGSGPPPIVFIALGNGDSTFVLDTSPKPNGPGGAVAVADFDGDGRLDVVALACGEGRNGCGPGARLVVVRNTADAFSTAVAVDIGVGSRHVAVGDLNGDGRPDVVVATDSNELLVFLTGPLQAAAAQVPAPTGLQIVALAVVVFGVGALALRATRAHS